jgi:simple sugar transport system permease protein
LSALIAWIVGIGYGILLNRVKGSEMTVSTYVGFSIIAFMNILWVTLPFTSGDIKWPIGGEGARNTISLSKSFSEVMNNTLSFTIGDPETGLFVPTGLLLFFFLFCFLVFLFFKSKTGIAMTAAGSNPNFAKASGINVNKMRIIGTALSTSLGAIGIITYAQAFGFLQMYNAPLMMGFSSVAAVLIGGASTTRAKISNVIIGTFLFQGLLVVALPVANKVLVGTDLSDIMRMIISNGIILYALTKAKGGATNEE